MSVADSSPVVQSPSTIDFTNLPTSLTQEVLTVDPTADAYAKPKLLHGLYRKEDGLLALKPEIEKRLPQWKRERIDQLLGSSMESQANSLAACRILNKVQAECRHGHEAEYVKIRCGKPFVCLDCAIASSRVRKFHYEHPYLYEYLMNHRFYVLTFFIDEPDGSGGAKAVRSRLAKAQQQFAQFASEFQSGDPGWYFLAAFDNDQEDAFFFQRTKFFAIYDGPNLPHWPTLNARWKAICPTGSLRMKLFDGKDGDDYAKGLQLAFSGFEAFHEAAADMDGWPEVDYAQAFENYDTCTPYGSFRGFESRVSEDRKAASAEVKAVCVEGQEHAPSKPICTTCKEPMVAAHHVPLMTDEETAARYPNGARFGHSIRLIYGRKPTADYSDHAKSTAVSPSPPS